MPSLRVMTYNVRYFGHGTRGITSTKAAISRIATSLANLTPLADLVCLQEVETQSLRSEAVTKRGHPAETQLERVMLELDKELARAGRTNTYSAYYFPAHRYKLTEQTNIYTTGLAVLAKDDLRVDHHNADQPHDITHRRGVRNLKQTRICAHIAFEHKSGHTIDVFNTHLSLPGLFYREFWTSEARMGFGPNQLEEVKTLARFIREEKKSNQLIVVGDFNSLPGSPVDEYMRKELGLVDAFSQAQHLSVNEARAFPTAGFLNLRMHLDHVYSSDQLEWIDFEGTQAFGRKGAFAGLSDHVPLIARCRVKDHVSNGKAAACAVVEGAK